MSGMIMPTVKPMRLLNTSVAQYRVLQRIMRGDRMACATHTNATFTALERKACIHRVAAGRAPLTWGIDARGEVVLAARGKPVLLPLGGAS